MTPAPTQRWQIFARPDSEAVRRDLAAFHADTAGSRLHLWCVMILCVASVGPTTATELAGLPLLICSALRLRTTLRAARWAMLQPLYVALALFCAWQWISLLWTPDLREGVQQAAATRWIWYYPLVFPVLDRRRRIIGALMLGFLIGNSTQLAHAIGVRLDIPALRWNRLPGRDSGWWDPVVAGSLLCGALGLMLPCILPAGVAWKRLAGLAGAVVTFIAILATGTRGAWIASAALVTIFGAVATLRAANHGTVGFTTGTARPGRVLAIGLIATLLLLAAGVALGPTIRARVGQASKDLRAAIQQRDFSTDTGARLLMAWRAIEAIGEHPVRGVGAGGFRAWSLSGGRDADPHASAIHAHAHNALLHLGATTGAVGLLLGVSVVCIGIRNAWHAGSTDPGGFPHALGPCFALTGLLLVSAFDAIHINAQTSALTCLLLSLSPIGPCPAAADRPAQTDSGSRV